MTDREIEEFIAREWFQESPWQKHHKNACRHGSDVYYKTICENCYWAANFTSDDGEAWRLLLSIPAQVAKISDGIIINHPELSNTEFSEDGKNYKRLLAEGVVSLCKQGVHPHGGSYAPRNSENQSSTEQSSFEDSESLGEVDL